VKYEDAVPGRQVEVRWEKVPGPIWEPVAPDAKGSEHGYEWGTAQIKARRRRKRRIWVELHVGIYAINDEKRPERCETGDVTRWVPIAWLRPTTWKAGQ